MKEILHLVLNLPQTIALISPVWQD